MSDLNRKRHVVVLSDSAWEKYSALVDGYQMVGTVQRGEYVAALALKDGKYYAVVQGRCDPLVQRKIELGVQHATAE